MGHMTANPWDASEPASKVTTNLSKRRERSVGAVGVLDEVMDDQEFRFQVEVYQCH